MDERPATKAALNERHKLRAGTYNAIALGFMGFGVIQPVVYGEFTWVSASKLVVSALIAYIFHRHAIYLLGRLED